MKLWEFVNPSDPYTFRAPDFLTAAAVTMLLGGGKAGLQPIDHEEPNDLPMFAFCGPGTTEKWLAEHYGDFGKWLDAHRLELADALDSFMSFSAGERRAYDLAMERLPTSEREAYRAEIHDKNRSSMNDFGSYAWELARQLRERRIEEQ